MLASLQELLVRALRDPDPLRFLQQHVAAHDGLSEQERSWLLGLNDDGLRLSRMLIRKLRLQRVLRGDPAAQREMAEDPAGFAARFANYDRDVLPTCVFPADEAAAFRSYR